MDTFSLNDHIGAIHSAFPPASERPLIGITGNYTDAMTTLSEGYYKQVAAAGGVPVIIPPCADKEVIINTLADIDGLLLTGGGDFNPLWCGEEPLPRLGGINPERDLAELLTARLAYDRNIPILGICRGIQTLAIAIGGSVAQDIASCRKGSQDMPMIKHSQDAPRTEPTHTVDISESSTLFKIYGRKRLYVNSVHHQAVSGGGDMFNIVATARDGVIEAMESCRMKPVIGVQWHPEWLGDEGLKLFRWLTDEASIYRKAKQLHSQIITLDSHCDTPMLFAQGVSFDKRDSKALVDLHKMSEGRLDAVTMAAYLPQPKDEKEDFKAKVAFDVSGPRAYADLIFDKIEEIVERNKQHIAIARNAAEVIANKRLGLKTIMLAIENGIALEHDISNIAHFASRGIVYITLCHNGDNDICDSARSSIATHNGVSEFGEKVIRAMNNAGIMVDMSHAGEASFYDAIDISSTPIVCSHSNCKALCNVLRNLTDDQLRAIAKKGGVAQTTFYAGFLRDGNANEATVIDAISHLEHAISIMGIDHVGIGTDFDGDGGVKGMANASDAIAFTMRLLRRKYSPTDIAKIWGGNWLRVMTDVQQAAHRY